MRNVLMRLAIIAGFIGLGFSPSAAVAAIDSGTPALTIRPLTVFQGPGYAYDVVGDISAKVRVTVDRCTYQWCQVHGTGPRGWVARDDLSFGTEARGPFTGPVLNFASGGPGTVCLYEGRGFSGEALCLSSGRVISDLLLHHRDDRYSSITIEGNVSVTLCRDRDFASYCKRITKSASRLDGFLDNNVSSLRVH